MKLEFKKYLESVGLTDLFLERSKATIEFYEEFLNFDIKDIFVSEYFDSEGKRQYESIWVFSTSLMCEAKRFLNREIFDAAPFIKKIKYWELKKNDFDLGKASDQSRMTINIELTTGIAAEFKASKKNCIKLKNIFKKYITPNIAE